MKKFIFLVIIIIAIILIAAVSIQYVLLSNNRGNISSTGNSLTGLLWPTYRIGSTNTTLAMVYFYLNMIIPSALSVNGLTVLLNETPTIAYSGSYNIHYPKGNGISESISSSHFWLSSPVNNSEAYMILFPSLTSNGMIEKGMQLDLIYANISFMGNTVILKPAPFSLMGWEGMAVDLNHTGYNLQLVGVVGDSNYIDGLHLYSNWNTDFKNSTAIFNLTVKNNSDAGYLPLPFKFYIINLQDYDPMIMYNVSSLNNPTLIDISGSVSSANLIFNVKNNTAFGEGDSLSIKMKFYSTPNPYYMGNNWGFEILYDNQQLLIGSLVPP